MRVKQRESMYEKLYNRALKLQVETREFLDFHMDAESAYKKFKMDLEKWLSADDFNFVHDYVGITHNIVRDKFPAKNFNHFVPRFATK